MSSHKIRVTAASGGEFDAYIAEPPAGTGPGLVIIQEIFGVNHHMRSLADRYARQGFLVAVPDLFWRMEPGVELTYDDQGMKKGLDLYANFNTNDAIADIDATVNALKNHDRCTKKVATVGFCMGGKLSYLAAARLNVDAAVSYYGGGIQDHLEEGSRIKCPAVLHYGQNDDHIPADAISKVRKELAANQNIEIFVYPGTGHGFNCDERKDFHKQSAEVAYARSLAVLNRGLGVRCDLNAVWEEHLKAEFSTHDPDASVSTMTPDAYVNHIPTMTGASGREALKEFYSKHFIPVLPADCNLIPLSRTISANRIVDELIFCVTHDKEIDFLLPGIPPTGRYLMIPTVAIVTFEGDKLVKEHIYWDQASALKQLGLLDDPALPIAGAESAHKALDPKAPFRNLEKETG